MFLQTKNLFQFAKKKQAELEDLQGIVFEGSDDSIKKNKIIDVSLAYY